jgi:hypothetical protein
MAFFRKIESWVLGPSKSVFVTVGTWARLLGTWPLSTWWFWAVGPLGPWPLGPLGQVSFTVPKLIPVQ